MPPAPSQQGWASEADTPPSTFPQQASRREAPPPASAPPALASAPFGDLRDLLGLSATLSNHDVLRNALIQPISKLQHCPPEQLQELTFVQATIFACLELKQLHALERLAMELRAGTPQLDRTRRSVAAAAGQLQQKWRRKISRQKPEAQIDLQHANRLPPARCLVFGSLAIDLKAQVTNRPYPTGTTTEAGEFLSSPGGKAANEAVQIARLGVGRVGDDELGMQARNNLQLVNHEALGDGDGAVEWEDSIFSDEQLGTGRATPCAVPRRAAPSPLGARTAARTATRIPSVAPHPRLDCTPAAPTAPGVPRRRSVALQMVFAEDVDTVGQALHSTTTKVTVVCGGANLGISQHGPEVQHIGAALSAYGAGAPELVLLQLEINLGPMLAVAQAARKHGCLVALKPSPLIPGKTLPAALALLPYTDLIFLNETEAPVLLRALDPAFDAAPRELVTVAEAEAVAEALLQRCEGLHTVLITSLAGHVLRQRGVPIPRGHATLVEASRKLSAAVQRRPSGAAPFARGATRALLFSRRGDGRDEPDVTLVVPRREVKTVDVIGAADAFVGGFVGAHCRRLSVCQSVLWAHAAGCLSLTTPGAQSSLATGRQVIDYLAREELAHCSVGGCNGSLRPYLAAPFQPADVASPAPPLPGGACPAALQPATFLLQTRLHLAAARPDLPALARLLLLRGGGRGEGGRVGGGGGGGGDDDDEGDDDDDDDEEEEEEGEEGDEFERLSRKSHGGGDPTAAAAARARRVLRALVRADATGCTPLQRAYLSWKFTERKQTSFPAAMLMLICARLVFEALAGPAPPPPSPSPALRRVRSEPADSFAAVRPGASATAAPAGERRSSRAEKAFGAPAAPPPRPPPKPPRPPLRDGPRSPAVHVRTGTLLSAPTPTEASIFEELEPRLFEPLGAGAPASLPAGACAAAAAAVLGLMKPAEAARRAASLTEAPRRVSAVPAAAPSSATPRGGARPASAPARPGGAAARGAGASADPEEACARLGAELAVWGLAPEASDRESPRQSPVDHRASGGTDRMSMQSTAPRPPETFRAALLAARAPHGTTLLMAAAEKEQEALVRALIETCLGDGAANGGAGAAFLKARDRRGRTALHLAARTGHVAICQMLVRQGGLSLEDTDKDGESPISLAMRTDARTRAMVSREALRALHELLRETRTSFGCFLSHCKADAEGVARTLKEYLSHGLAQSVFLDSDDLKSLQHLQHHVRHSQVLVLIQTKHVLQRPYCLLELLTAVEAKVPIVGVNIVGDGYSFDDAGDFLSRLDTELEKHTPGASKILIEHGYKDLKAAGAKLHAVLPKMISLNLNFAASLDLVDEIMRQQAVSQEKQAEEAGCAVAEDAEIHPGLVDRERRLSDSDASVAIQKAHRGHAVRRQTSNMGKSGRQSMYALARLRRTHSLEKPKQGGGASPRS